MSFLLVHGKEKSAVTLAKRLRSHGKAIIYFLEDPAIEYTNYLSANS